MLYLDSSALSKRYLHERGTEQLKAKLAATDEAVLTSFLTYAEIHTALARKLKERSLRTTEYQAATRQFDSDWRTYLTRVELSQYVLELIPPLVNRHALKASDAVQLASALWAADATDFEGIQEPQRKSMAFVTADKQLAEVARDEQFEVFNPELP